MLTFSRIFLKFLLAFSLCFTLKVYAARSMQLQHVSYDKLNETIAIQLNKSQALPSKHIVNSLNFMQERTDQNQVKHIRLQQYYMTIPILGGNAIVHKKNQDVQRINGTIYQELSEDLGEHLPYTDRMADDIKNAFSKAWPARDITTQTISPIIFIDKDSKAHWAYLIGLYIRNKDSSPSKPTAIIDIYTKDKLVEWDNIKTSRTLVKGLGFGGNHKMGLVQYGRDLPFLNISHDDFLEICYMENKEVKVVDMQGRYIGDNLPMVSNCSYSKDNDAYWTGYNLDGYDKINGAYSTSDDALHIASIIKDMYKKIYKVEPLVYKDQPQQLIMRVHYGKSYANAFWDGEQMSFGDGDYNFYPLVSKSIGAHEISHGFTEQHSNLVYFGQSGAINESFSDMAAQAIEYYEDKKNSWQIGREIIKNSAQMEAIRFMDKPSQDKHSIEFAHHYRDGMDVHYSSGVYNKLFYLIATTPNWNTQKAFKLMLKANMDYWTPTSNFQDAACGIIYAAKDLKYSTIDVKNALEEVIIDYDNC